MDLNQGLGINTLLTHFAEEQAIKGSVVPPIFQVSTFVFDDYDNFLKGIIDNPQGPPFHYSRLGNPSLDVVERKLAMLEKTDAAKLIGTGMGAATLAIMANVSSGTHVVAVDTCYGPVRQFLSEYLPKFGVTCTFVSGLSTEDLLDAIKPETKLIYLESPSSIIFRLQDIEAIAKVAREKKVATVIDNTYCTPLNSNPATMGVDIIVHSATKYLGGHSDLCAGVICGSEEFMRELVKVEVNLFGSILAPFPAWLLMRGMRTLGVRMKHHEAVGNEVAAWLETHPRVDRVHHVGLPSFPQRDLFLKQMRAASSLLSFEPKVQEDAKVFAFVNALKLFRIGVSWGGHESLAVPIFGQPLGYSEPRYCVRLYCGLEDTADLIADVQQAFEVSGL